MIGLSEQVDQKILPTSLTKTAEKNMTTAGVNVNFCHGKRSCVNIFGFNFTVIFQSLNF